MVREVRPTHAGLKRYMRQLDQTFDRVERLIDQGLEQARRKAQVL
jgi:hypothetical protein